MAVPILTTLNNVTIDGHGRVLGYATIPYPAHGPSGRAVVLYVSTDNGESFLGHVLPSVNAPGAGLASFVVAPSRLHADHVTGRLMILAGTPDPNHPGTYVWINNRGGLTDSDWYLDRVISVATGADPGAVQSPLDSHHLISRASNAQGTTLVMESRDFGQTWLQISRNPIFETLSNNYIAVRMGDRLTILLMYAGGYIYKPLLWSFEGGWSSTWYDHMNGIDLTTRAHFASDSAEVYIDCTTYNGRLWALLRVQSSDFVTTGWYKGALVWFSQFDTVLDPSPPYFFRANVNVPDVGRGGINLGTSIYINQHTGRIHWGVTHYSDDGGRTWVPTNVVPILA